MNLNIYWFHTRVELLKKNHTNNLYKLIMIIMHRMSILNPLQIGFVKDNN